MQLILHPKCTKCQKQILKKREKKSHKKLFQFDFTSCIINNFIVKKICENYTAFDFINFWFACLSASNIDEITCECMFDETRDVNVYGQELIWKQ